MNTVISSDNYKDWWWLNQSICMALGHDGVIHLFKCLSFGEYIPTIPTLNEWEVEQYLEICQHWQKVTNGVEHYSIEGIYFEVPDEPQVA